jgi:glycerol-3-phosphate dehydrogenase
MRSIPNPQSRNRIRPRVSGVSATRSSSLNAGRRSDEIDRLAGGESVDLVVIGGGITGTGVALDAATRGLRVALVERRDLANGTSGLSSKLAHGGLRYLRQGEVAVAWESARERHTLMSRTAPHLVRPMAFVAPLDEAMGPVYGAFAETGIRVGDVMRAAAGTRRGALPGPRRIDADATLRLIPSLRRDDLRGAILFWDGKLEDDVRLVIAVARTAAANGAMILTYCDALEVERGRVTVRETVGGRRFEIATKHVVNATGIWAEGLAPGVQLAPSKGSHVIVRGSSLGNIRASVVVPIAGESARWVGATPTSDGHIIIGVTDEPYHGPPGDQPTATPAEERYLLDALSRALEVPLDHDDVIGSYAGLRPLLSAGGESTRDLSRRHAILEDSRTGMVTVVGGKLTTYRRMAQDTLDRLLRGGGARSVTARLPLVGAAPPAVLQRLEAPERLVRRYGIEAPAVASLAAGDPTLLQPLAEGVSALGVEILFGLRHEGALTLDDLLDRRVRLGLIPAERAAAETAVARLAT